MKQRILLESSPEPWQPQFVRNAATRFAELYDVEAVIIDSLYDSSPRKIFQGIDDQVDKNLLDPFAAFFGWLSPRASRILLQRQGITDEELPIEDFRRWETVASGVQAAARRFNFSPGSGRVVDLTDKTPQSARWYPVIDGSRCVNCLECLNFCMFGVYSITDSGAITVESPDSCRNGCPACSRICPQSAILFPRCEDDRISGWDESPLSDGSAGTAGSAGTRSAGTRSAGTRSAYNPAPASASPGLSAAALQERERYVNEAKRKKEPEAAVETSAKSDLATPSAADETRRFDQLLDDIDSQTW